MTIDTKKKVIAIQIRRMITLLVFAILIICVLLIGKLPNTFLGLDKYSWSIVIAGLYLFAIISENIFQFNYIYFSDENNRLVLRYFSLGYFNRTKKSIEFPTDELLSYQIYEYMYGYKKRIVLHRIRNNKEAKYSPVSLSILSKEEYSQFIKALDSYKKF